MRILRVLLLALLLCPALAPCCAEAVESSCPAERASSEICESRSPEATVTSAVLMTPPQLDEPVVQAIAVPRTVALGRPLALPQRVPLRN